jgi:hypothetical protein
MDQALGSRCPGCGQDAALTLSVQAFCGNDECHVMCWDPEQTLQQFADTAECIDLADWSADP